MGKDAETRNDRMDHDRGRWASIARSIGLRWLIFASLFALSLLAPIPLVYVFPNSIFTWSVLWILLATAPEGFFAPETGAVYLEGSAFYLAYLSWALIGLVYAVLTRRVALRYVALAAYPAMAICMWIFVALLGAFGLAHYAPSL